VVALCMFPFAFYPVFLRHFCCFLACVLSACSVCSLFFFIYLLLPSDGLHACYLDSFLNEVLSRFLSVVYLSRFRWDSGRLGAEMLFIQ
jgi:hypothetical protein